MNEASERSPGRRLREARERMNLTAARVAEQLRLEPQRLAALEGDRFEELGAAVYVRGHLRKYAELVNLPAEELIAAFVEQSRMTPAPSLIPAASARDLSISRRRNPMPALAAVALALVVGGLWWWFTQGPIGLPGRMAVPQSGTEAAAAAEGDVAAHAAATGPVAAESSAVPTGATDTAPAATSGAALLDVRFRAQSWFEVYDAADRRVAFELVPAGSHRSLRAAPPLRVLLGSASGVSLALDGRVVQVPRALLVAETAWIEIDARGAVREAAPRRVDGQGD